MGFLCGAAMYARPEVAAPALVPPLVEKVLRLLEGTETSGASGAEPDWVKEKGSKKVGWRSSGWTVVVSCFLAGMFWLQSGLALQLVAMLSSS